VLNLQWKHRFATRMIAAFVIVILIPTLFTSASFYLVSNSTVKGNARESSVQIARQAADSLSYILNAGGDLSDFIYSDQRIQNVVKKETAAQSNLREWREDEEYLKSVLNHIVYSNSFVTIVYVLKDQEQSWGSGTFSKAKLAQYDLSGLDWARAAREKDGAPVWMGLQVDRFSGAGDNTEFVLPVVRTLKDFSTMDNIGYVVVNVNGRKIIEQLRQARLGESGSFFVVNEEGRIMIDANPERINQRVENPQLLHNIVGSDYIEFEYKSGGIPYYGVKQPLNNGWYIVGTVPVREITRKLDSLNHNIIMSFGAFTLAGILIGLYLATRVTRPIKQLTAQMRVAQQGDLTVRTMVESNDEFGLMSKQFNRMMSEIHSLMEQVKLEQQQKREAELRAVAHRINPHFLFNTLSTLRWLIKYGQTAKADQGISALIRLLEANMGKKGNFITIREELDIIEKYLAILELRYSRTFHLDVRVDSTAGDFIIPRMLIQPLVENAIFHGIVPKDIDGEIFIDAVCSGDAVIINVTDNGTGILPDKMVFERSVGEAVEAGRSGIGLKHVHENIKLYFGIGSEVQLRNRQSGGAAARMILYPKPHREEEKTNASSDDR
jgi:two-component system, sensor histidine kinase YesM